MGNCINMFWYEMLLYWSELIYKNKISTFQDVVNQLLWLNSHVKYNKAVLYAPCFVQQGIMLIANILPAEYKLPTLTQLNVKFNVEWNEYIYDKFISAIQIEWRTLIQSNTSITFIKIPIITIHCKINKEKKQQNSFILHS